MPGRKVIIRRKKRSEQSQQLVDRVYEIIRKNSGRVRSTDLHLIIGDKEAVHYALSQLNLERKIKRIRGLGEKGVEYFYYDIESKECQKLRNHLGGLKMVQQSKDVINTNNKSPW